MKILIVEDNKKISRYIKKSFEEVGYRVDCCFDGEEAVEVLMSRTFDAVILDVMLPSKDGISVCREVREQGVVTPILMLTARGEIDDRIVGLDSGADDYLIKPFDLKELLARMRALLRRPSEKIEEKITVGDLVIDLSTRAVTRNGKSIPFTFKEYEVLEYLMRNKNRALARNQILDHCWDYSFDAYSNIVDVYIKQIRKKLDHDPKRYIETVRNIGYQFKE